MYLKFLIIFGMKNLKIYQKDTKELFGYLGSSLHFYSEETHAPQGPLCRPGGSAVLSGSGDLLPASSLHSLAFSRIKGGTADNHSWTDSL